MGKVNVLSWQKNEFLVEKLTLMHLAGCFHHLMGLDSRWWRTSSSNPSLASLTGDASRADPDPRWSRSLPLGLAALVTQLQQQSRTLMTRLCR